MIPEFGDATGSVSSAGPHAWVRLFNNSGSLVNGQIVFDNDHVDITSDVSDLNTRNYNDKVSGLQVFTR